MFFDPRERIAPRFRGRLLTEARGNARTEQARTFQQALPSIWLRSGGTSRKPSRISIVLSVAGPGQAAGKSLARRGERLLRYHAGGGVKSSDAKSAGEFTGPSSILESGSSLVLPTTGGRGSGNSIGGCSAVCRDDEKTTADDEEGSGLERSREELVGEGCTGGRDEDAHKEQTAPGAKANVKIGNAVVCTDYSRMNA